MLLSRASLALSDGRKMEVSESTWESASIRSRIEEQARTDRARLNGSGDPVFLFFLETYYSYLASVSSGDVPSAEEALALSNPDLDAWYLAVVDVNPDSFVKFDRHKTGEVSFRDGSRFEIVSSYLPSVTMTRVRLEEEALKREPDRNNPKDIFGVYLYPLLASCSQGDIPSAEVVRSTWPESEIYKWRDEVEAVNPQLFGEAVSVEETKALEKKSSRRRVKSPPS